MVKVISLIIALMTTFVVTTVFAFNAYFTTIVFISVWTLIITYYLTIYVIQTLKKTAS